MNKATWDRLPEDIRDAFREASGPSWLAQLGATWRATDDAAIEKIVADGNTHVVLSDEETSAFSDALEAVVTRWKQEVSEQGIDGEDLVTKARELIANHSSVH